MCPEQTSEAALLPDAVADAISGLMAAYLWRLDAAGALAEGIAAIPQYLQVPLTIGPRRLGCSGSI